MDQLGEGQSITRNGPRHRARLAALLVFPFLSCSERMLVPHAVHGSIPLCKSAIAFRGRALGNMVILQLLGLCLLCRLLALAGGSSPNVPSAHLFVGGH
ncbi:hypothetical protein Pelo_3745 [Pelomyxa schiedti]|nr:hypothetical protein Pelo_3745 [Pelomyxa schiedti]